jgi:hypothetical protein
LVVHKCIVDSLQNLRVVTADAYFFKFASL